MKTYKCKHCGCTEVFRDAMAEWDWDKQEWVLCSVFDTAYCNACEGETTIIEVDPRITPRSTSPDSFAKRYTVQARAKSGHWYDVLGTDGEEYAIGHAEYLTKTNHVEHRALDNWS